MVEDQVRRKLAAILSADVKGYSRLMSQDEASTFHTLTTYFGIMTGLIEKHHGRVVDNPGDNLLAEFSSVVNAVTCAVEIQRELAQRNEELPADRKMEFRIGINVGDVGEKNEKIFGDGVNIAARLEGRADPGGICISGSAYDQVRNKLKLGYESLGELRVKNIAAPVRAYRVLMTPEEEGVVLGEGGLRPRRSIWVVLIVVLAIVLVAVAVSTYRLYLRPGGPKSEIASTVRMAFPLPDKPSIAVLPFDNLSGDPQQEYFSDGMTDDLITDLSKVSGILVIARNSTFTYKGKAINVQQIGRELGAQYVLEGSVRKAGNRVRINAQLIDAKSGGHLWAERYDRDLKDVFAVQDEVTAKIVSALKVTLTEGEREQIAEMYTDSLEAYDFYLRALESGNRFTKDSNAEARKMLENAIKLDPEYALAYSKLGFTYLMDWIFGWRHDPGSIEEAFQMAQKALKLEKSLSSAHSLLGHVYLWKKQHALAIAEKEKAIALNPSNADLYADLGEILTWAGRPEEAIDLVEKAMRLNPRYPIYYLFGLGHAYFLTNRYEEAITTFKRVVNRNPNFWPASVYLAATYTKLGQEDEARAEAQRVFNADDGLSIDDWEKRLPYKDESVLEEVLDALRKAKRAAFFPGLRHPAAKALAWTHARSFA
jgi:adenylate cyclase